MKFRRDMMLHEVPEVVENFTFEPPCPDFLVEADSPHPASRPDGPSPGVTTRLEEHRSRMPTEVSKETARSGTSTRELVITLQAPADGIGDSQQEITHAVQVEAVKIDKDAPVAGTR